MELLPPAGWADLATKSDLDDRLTALELRLDPRFERGFRQVLVTVMSLMVTGFIATIVANLAS